jgi:16S rRNA (cytosine1402-N4)-methyltransferase
MSYHTPVLLNESLEGLKIQPEGIYVDVTYGGGGHSEAILTRLQGGRLYAFDQDQDALRNRLPDSRLQMIHGNFRYLKNFLRYYGVRMVDGVLADLGVSSFHFNEHERGFAFRMEGPLDMRMNQNADLTAALVLNTYSEEELMRVFRDYGEIDKPTFLVSLITEARKTEPFSGTSGFIQVIRSCIPSKAENNYLSRVFQALRIEVNKEMEALKEMLFQAYELLKPGGRLVVISYHSLEDRYVKNFMRSGNLKGTIEKDFYGNPALFFRLVNRKVIVPSANELRTNNRSRSAKLRIAEKI